MKQAQRGFTLIELVMVIVILGILAAVALPKFVDLKGDATKAAIQGVAGALASSSAIDYARSQILGAPAAVGNCADVGTLVSGGASGLVNGYTVGGTFPAACTVGDGTTTITWAATNGS